MKCKRISCSEGRTATLLPCINIHNLAFTLATSRPRSLLWYVNMIICSFICCCYCCCWKRVRRQKHRMLTCLLRIWNTITTRTTTHTYMVRVFAGGDFRSPLCSVIHLQTYLRMHTRICTSIHIHIYVLYYIIFEVILNVTAGKRLKWVSEVFSCTTTYIHTHILRI